MSQDSLFLGLFPSPIYCVLLGAGYLFPRLVTRYATSLFSAVKSLGAGVWFTVTTTFQTSIAATGTEYIKIHENKPVEPRFYTDVICSARPSDNEDV